MLAAKLCCNVGVNKANNNHQSRAVTYPRLLIFTRVRTALKASSHVCVCVCVCVCGSGNRSCPETARSKRLVKLSCQSWRSSTHKKMIHKQIKIRKCQNLYTSKGYFTGSGFTVLLFYFMLLIYSFIL